jgi:hypothetical protein
MFRRRRQALAEKAEPSRMFQLLQIGERPDLEDASLTPKVFPLYLDGSERMRFRYAIFLLNKASCMRSLIALHSRTMSLRTA